MIKYFIGWLLHYANSDPDDRTNFYALKDRLIAKYGELIGEDYQEIRKECWGDWYTGECGPNCPRCGGTGIYEIKWVRLLRWRIGDYLFHTPKERLYSKPETINIQGYVKHRDYGKASREAQLWLYLLTGNFRLFYGFCRSQCYTSPGWWPMCRVQWAIMNTRFYLKTQRCWCGRRFISWADGWLICKKCRTKQKLTQTEFDEAPF